MANQIVNHRISEALGGQPIIYPLSPQSSIHSVPNRL
jgi:hypothetical protein